VSNSRAKKKQRRRARAASAPAPAAPLRSEPDAVEARRERVEAREAQRTSTVKPAPARLPERFEVRDGIPRPRPVWAPFPLTEIGIFVGIVVFLLGYFASANRSPALLGTGAVVLAIVVGEMCLREHFAGFRSHSILLALLPVTILHTFVVYAITTGWNGPVALLVDLAVAAGLAWYLQQRYRDAHARAKIDTVPGKPKAGA
jgi:hypothetical protein